MRALARKILILIAYMNLSQHAALGHNRHTSETPFEWRFACMAIVAPVYTLTGSFDVSPH